MLPDFPNYNYFVPQNIEMKLGNGEAKIIKHHQQKPNNIAFVNE